MSLLQNNVCFLLVTFCFINQPLSTGVYYHRLLIALIPVRKLYQMNNKLYSTISKIKCLLHVKEKRLVVKDNDYDMYCCTSFIVHVGKSCPSVQCTKKALSIPSYMSLISKFKEWKMTHWPIIAL